MKLLDSISHFLFDYRGDAKASMDSKLVWLTWQRAIRYVGLLGVLVGIGGIVRFVTVHFWGDQVSVQDWLFVISWFGFFLSFCALTVFSLRMMTVGARSRVSIGMWFCTAISLAATLFKCFSFPGGELLQMFGLPNILAILCAIGFLTHMPQEYKWARAALGWWIIGTQLAMAVTWFVFWYHGVYYVDYFEPAIAYADMSVINYQQDAWKASMRCLVFGCTMLPLSTWLYIIARKHSK